MLALSSNSEMLAPACAMVERRRDGSFIVRSPQELQAYARCIGEWLEYWAIERPERTFLAERRNGDWFRLTYSQVRTHVGALAQRFLDMQLPLGRPLMVLSENDVDHALLSLAAMHVGIPVSAVSAAYAKNTSDYSRLKDIVEALQPGIIFVNDALAFGDALRAVRPNCSVVATRNVDKLCGAQPLKPWYETTETDAVMEAYKLVGPDTHARYLLTSGSTGAPKVVVNTQRMLCANQQAIVQCWRFLKHREIVVLDWLPWSHTFGANHNFNLIMANGGSLYIDDGRPVPNMINRTIANIKSIRPTLYFNVPRGYEVLLEYLETDQELRQSLFGRLEMLFYAAAALPQEVWDKLISLAGSVRKEKLFMSTEWGATETAPVVTNLHFLSDHPGNLGLPVPGVELKFSPNGDKLELCVRGDSIFGEYLNSPDLTAMAFDEEGFYATGDTGYLLDCKQPEKGIIFDGRVSEDFKLTSGTWVSVGTLRPRLVGALSPHAIDCVITGHDKDEIGALIFASPALKKLAGPGGDEMTGEQLVLVPEVRKALLRGMSSLESKTPSLSRHVRRLIVLDDLPRQFAGEITDKGYINQRRSLEIRSDEVERMYARQLDSGLVRLDELEGDNR